jgi:hypothetical protein
VELTPVGISAGELALICVCNGFQHGVHGVAHKGRFLNPIQRCGMYRRKAARYAKGQPATMLFSF